VAKSYNLGKRLGLFNDVVVLLWSFLLPLRQQCVPSFRLRIRFVLDLQPARQRVRPTDGVCALHNRTEARPAQTRSQASSNTFLFGCLSYQSLNHLTEFPRFISRLNNASRLCLLNCWNLEPSLVWRNFPRRVIVFKILDAFPARLSISLLWKLFSPSCRVNQAIKSTHCKTWNLFQREARESLIREAELTVNVFHPHGFDVCLANL